MTSNLVSDRPAAISLLRILAMIIIGFIVIGNVVALLVVSLLYSGNLAEAMNDPVGHPDIHTILVLAQGLAAGVGLVFVPWFYLTRIELKSFGRFFGKFPAAIWFVIVSAMVIALVLGISPITEWNANVELPEWLGAFGDFMKEMEPQASQLTKAMTSDMTPATFLLVLVVVGVIPAIGEEFVFRGLIQTEMQRAVRNPHLAIWLTAVFFSAFHLQFFGFVPRVLLGAFMGYLYFWSGNLWFPILAHFLNNGLQVIVLYLLQLKVHSFDPESTDAAPLPFVVTCIVLLAGLLYYCKKNIPAFTADRDTNPSKLQ